MEGYVLVLDQSGRLLYGSFALLQLSEDDRAHAAARSDFREAGRAGRAARRGRRPIAARRGRTRTWTCLTYSASWRRNRCAPPTSRSASSSAPFSPSRRCCSWRRSGLAYMIAGRAFEPVGLMINEVKAITDGRSLHRRLPIDEANEEMARLGITLNEMMERLEKSFSALRRFTADASHELKTPLAVLRADVERAMSGASTRAEQMVALEEALHETHAHGGSGGESAHAGARRRGALRSAPRARGAGAAGPRGVRNGLDSRRARRPNGDDGRARAGGGVRRSRRGCASSSSTS